LPAPECSNNHVKAIDLLALDEVPKPPDHTEVIGQRCFIPSGTQPICSPPAKVTGCKIQITLVSRITEIGTWAYASITGQLGWLTPEGAVGKLAWQTGICDKNSRNPGQAPNNLKAKLKKVEKKMQRRNCKNSPLRLPVLQ